MINNRAIRKLVLEELQKILVEQEDGDNPGVKNNTTQRERDDTQNLAELKAWGDKLRSDPSLYRQLLQNVQNSRESRIPSITRYNVSRIAQTVAGGKETAGDARIMLSIVGRGGDIASLLKASGFDPYAQGRD